VVQPADEIHGCKVDSTYPSKMVALERECVAVPDERITVAERGDLLQMVQHVRL
jgi:hypothetical protein